MPHLQARNAWCCFHQKIATGALSISLSLVELLEHIMNVEMSSLVGYNRCHYVIMSLYSIGYFMLTTHAYWAFLSVLNNKIIQLSSFVEPQIVLVHDNTAGSA